MIALGLVVAPEDKRGQKRMQALHAKAGMHFAFVEANFHCLLIGVISHRILNLDFFKSHIIAWRALVYFALLCAVFP